MLLTSGATDELTSDEAKAAGFEFDLNSGECQITSFVNTTTSGAVTIPSKIDGKSVTSIGNFVFMGYSGLTSIDIPSGVTSIGDFAFMGCSGLTSITIPNGATSIGMQAFIGCSGLTSNSNNGSSSSASSSSSSSSSNSSSTSTSTVAQLDTATEKAISSLNRTVGTGLVIGEPKQLTSIDGNILTVTTLTKKWSTSGSNGKI